MSAHDAGAVPQGRELAIPGDPPLPAYAILPAGARRGAVVLHEIYGRQPEIDRVVQRFAGAGYAAVAPDLFATGRLACVWRSLSEVASGKGVDIDRIARCRRWLCAEAGLEERTVGVIGFCLGGGFALAAAPGFGVVSTNYGNVPPTSVLRGIAPVIGCYGGRDLVWGRHGARLGRRLTELGVEHEVHTFPTVGHSFLTDGHHGAAEALSRPLLRVGYDSAVAEEGWARILAFFDRHLVAR